MKTEDIKNLGIVAALGFGAYALYTTLNAARKGLTTVGDAIGSGLYDFFHPNEMGETKFFLVTFPDGQRHSIPASYIDASGIFVNKPDPNNPTYKGDGKTYRIVKKTGAGTLTLAAFPLLRVAR